jgi:hypothetical protein
MLKDKLPSVTIFLGSFLIFGVQPMLGRTLLPAFGGTAAVWTTCLATYQVLLLAGYFYAHRMSIEKCANAGMRECGNETPRQGEADPRRECANGKRSTSNAQRLTFNEDNKAIRQSGNKAMHIVLLGLAVAWVAGFAWGRPWLMAHIGNSACPALEVLLCVLAFVGLPYVLLSANSTLVQAWVAGETPRQGEADPRREEKCANAGMRECGNEEEKCANARMRECGNEEEKCANARMRECANEGNQAIRQCLLTFTPFTPSRMPARCWGCCAIRFWWSRFSRWMRSGMGLQARWGCMGGCLPFWQGECANARMRECANANAQRSTLNVQRPMEEKSARMRKF